MDAISKALIADLNAGIEAAITGDIPPLSQRACKILESKSVTEAQRRKLTAHLSSSIEQTRAGCRKIGRVIGQKYLSPRVKQCKLFCQQKKYIENLGKADIARITEDAKEKRIREKTRKKNNNPENALVYINESNVAAANIGNSSNKRRQIKKEKKEVEGEQAAKKTKSEASASVSSSSSAPAPAAAAAVAAANEPKKAKAKNKDFTDIFDEVAHEKEKQK